MPISSASRPGTPWSLLSLTITSDDSTIAIPMDRSMPAVRMITRLADGQRPDDGHLLDEQRQRLRPQEVVGEEAEDDDGHDQHDQRAQRRVAVQDVLDPLGGGVPGGDQILRRGGCLGGL